MSKDAQALLSGFYVGIRANRQQRRNFLSTMLRLFDDVSTLKGHVSVYTIENLAKCGSGGLDIRRRQPCTLSVSAVR